MKSGETGTVRRRRRERIEIYALTDEGEGIGRTRTGQTVVVAGVLVGERIEVLASERSEAGRSDAVLHGELAKVVTSSSHRVVARCAHADACGGCGWQHIAYDEQLRLKRERCRQWLADALGTKAPAVDETIATPHMPGQAPWGYRQKVHFVFTEAGGRVAVGHFVRRSSKVLPVHECPVHAPDGNRLAFALCDALAEAKVPSARMEAERGTARHVVVRVAEGTPERGVTVVTRCADPRVGPAAERAVSAAGCATAHIYVNLHAGHDSYLFGPATRIIRGRGRMREEIAGTSYLLSPTAFFQTNVSGAARLLELVLAAVPREADVVADLYAGVGLFALPLARRGHRVVAVEENVQAVADGVASRSLNRIPEARCRFVSGRVGAVLARGLGVAPRVVVMDPPRSGCEPRVLQAICRDLRPDRIVYVSCNPATLARDLSTAARYGYVARRVTPIDMFPHTPHVEAFAIVEPLSPTSRLGAADYQVDSRRSRLRSSRR